MSVGHLNEKNNPVVQLSDCFGPAITTDGEHVQLLHVVYSIQSVVSPNRGHCVKESHTIWKHAT